MLLSFTNMAYAQDIIPLDTNNWFIQAQAYVLEKHLGADAIYLQGGSMALKDVQFLNGTIEFDIHLKKEQAFPGVYFRFNDKTSDAEQFYVRPHQSGNPDANQAAPLTKGITPWQLYFGPKYSFPYEYAYDRYTHIKLVVRDRLAQVFLDHSASPHLSWNLFHEPSEGKLLFTGGSRSGFHIANVHVSSDPPDLVQVATGERAPIENLIQQWEISDMFEEAELLQTEDLDKLIAARKWQGKVSVEEGTAANISRIQKLRDGTPGNTVLARITFNSSKEQLKLFEFGYSDRLVAILNGKPLYQGTNKWRSRDYRYLGTVGLFDSVFLHLKEGKNELVMAVSEDFGGWLITGRFNNMDGIKLDK